MNKEEALNEFLKGLRIVLNNSSAYSKDHPYFHKSVEFFKQKVDGLLVFLNPIKMNISPDALFVGEKKLEKSMLYIDLAAMFHRRKIKSIEIRPGFSIEEMIEFLGAVSLPIKEIINQGGIQNILSKLSNNHISVLELDYSSFLQNEGQEAKDSDLWRYLFKETVRKENVGQMNEFADNFGGLLSKFKAKNILDDSELRESLHQFLGYLKAKEKNKFNNCSKELLGHVLKDKNMDPNVAIDKLQAFFKDVDKNSLAEALWDQISNNEAFNYSSFQLFSHLVSHDSHKDIAANIGEKIKSTESLQDNPAIRKKIKELFSGTDKSSALEFYHQALYLPLEHVPSERSLSFDKDFLPVSYFLVLLNLLRFEDEKEKLDVISQRLLSECDRLIFQKEVKYLKSLWEVLEEKSKKNLFPASDFTEFKKRIFGFVENEIFEDEAKQGVEYFIEKIQDSTLGEDFYFNKIFKERKVSPVVLKLFLRLFSQDLSRFYEKLKEMHIEIDFVARIIKGIEMSGSSLGAQVLMNIYSISGNVIKIEALKAMQSFPVTDGEFLFSVMDEGDVFMKKEALVLLIKDVNLKKKALDKLFNIKSTLGNKNDLIMQNLIAIEDKPMEEVVGLITALSKRKFFWNKNVREKALEILRKWDVG